MNIGFIDSGIGGISTLKECLKEFPDMDYIYIADTLYAPYGNLNKDFLIKRIKHLIHILESKGADKIVLACNSSSTISYYENLENAVPIIRVVPEIKKALYENSGKILLLSTVLTSNSMYVKRFHTSRLSVLGEQYLAGKIEKAAPKFSLLKDYIKMILEPYFDIDAILLGCTHYLFVEDIVREILPDAKIYNSNERVIKELKYNYFQEKQKKEKKKEFIITGDEKEKYLHLIKTLLTNTFFDY